MAKAGADALALVRRHAGADAAAANDNAALRLSAAHFLRDRTREIGVVVVGVEGVSAHVRQFVSGGRELFGKRALELETGHGRPIAIFISVRLYPFPPGGEQCAGAIS